MEAASSVEFEAVPISTDGPMEAVSSVEAVPISTDGPMAGITKDFFLTLPEPWQQVLQNLPNEAKPPANFTGATGSYVAYPHGQDKKAYRVGVWLPKKSFYAYSASAVALPAGITINTMGGANVPFGGDPRAAWKIAVACFEWVAD